MLSIVMQYPDGLRGQIFWGNSGIDGISMHVLYNAVYSEKVNKRMSNSSFENTTQIPVSRESQISHPSSQNHNSCSHRKYNIKSLFLEIT